jgi:predicted Zn-ribbon and HTH transcriptional regulator
MIDRARELARKACAGCNCREIAAAIHEAVEERDRDWMADQIACIVRFNAEQGEREAAKREAKVVEERERMLAEACERAKDPGYVVEDWAARHHHYLEPAAKTELIEKVRFALQSRLDEQAKEIADLRESLECLK